MHILADIIQGLNSELKGIQKYSTNETDTGATWINNKKIYRKVIVMNSVPEADETVTQAHDISDIDYVITVKPIIKVIDSDTFTNLNSEIITIANLTHVIMIASSALAIPEYTCNILLEYTKYP